MSRVWRWIFYSSAIVAAGIILSVPVSSFADEASINTQKALQNEWEGCLIEFASKVALENVEPAEAVVRASFVSCTAHEDALYIFFQQKMTETTNKAVAESNLEFLNSYFFPAIKKDYGDKILATILVVRSN